MTLVLLDLMLVLKVRSQKEKGEEVEAELQRQLGSQEKVQRLLSMG